MRAKASKNMKRTILFDFEASPSSCLAAMKNLSMSYTFRCLLSIRPDFVVNSVKPISETMGQAVSDAVTR